MHWLWLADTLSLLLTGAIAWAAVTQTLLAHRQAVTSENLLSLQQTIEKQRTTAWIFLRVNSIQRAPHEQAILDISNLSEVGVWIEKITVNVQVPAGSANQDHTLPILSPLKSMGTMRVENFPQEIFLLVAATGAVLKNIVFSVDVEFWAKGSYRSESTSVYSADVNQWSIQNLRSSG
jgi:hypothetical protein